MGYGGNFLIKCLVSKETVVERRLRSETRTFGIKQVGKGQNSIVKKNEREKV